MKLTILIGPSGSGKSTYAKTYEDTVYVNQDSQGKDGHVQVFLKALEEKKDIVIDRMDFNKEQRKRYIEPAKAAGYFIHGVVFQVSEAVCLHRCLERQGHETITTERSARSALHTFFKNYESPDVSEGFNSIMFLQHTVQSQPAIIVDLDGTLADIEHRLHFVKTEGKKKDWGGFFKAMSDDGVNEWCRSIIRKYNVDHGIILVSGRPDDYKKVTEEWLAKHEIPYDELHMRKRGDFRKDDIVKSIIYDFNVAPYYDIKFCVDDRQQVVDLWRSKGLVCLQCDKGDF